ncbi:hypothetical protein CLHUN_00950 [Ruminiclostridium hungatei]|uniref:CdiA toxin EC869-like domain-containing protein n=1 Tax=Ruminiclostridium hungatei TaxID=48256 RepID=A0A1V4SQW0_RUMHU|nr:pilus assembly protein TadE [Ruminiclostridium hungatei]OPX46279.1 hypothetical protein CLHUN_00950 [Ruminiclostridium hungatei]
MKNLCKSNMFLKGSITVEAAVILPFAIMAVLTFVFIIKIYYTYDVVQNAITGTGRQMSAYSLLYYKTDAEEIISGIERFGSSDAVSDALGDNWLSSSLRDAGKNAADYIRTQLALIPITRQLVSRQLETCFGADADKALRRLDITDGLSGLDFSQSKMLADGKSIDIIVQYKINFPILSGVLPEIQISQTASVCIWAGENGIGGEENGEAEKTVWDMSNIKRGQAIRKLQGANLPFNFPTVASFKNGTATSVKSLNIDEPYYKDAVSLEKKISGYVKKLDEFWSGSCGDISINESEILRKELILVIPETELSSDQQNVVDRCVKLAELRGITLNVIKAYGKKGGNSGVPDTDEGGKQSTEGD